MPLEGATAAPSGWSGVSTALQPLTGAVEPRSVALAAALPAPQRARLTAEIDRAAPAVGPSVVRFLHWILR